MPPITTSAPAKVILFGEHSVNRQQPALVTAIDLRLSCRAEPLPGIDDFVLRAGERCEHVPRAEALVFRNEIDALRQAEALDDIRQRADRFFAPTTYVLGHTLAHLDKQGLSVPGLQVEWESPIPMGSGLGSGAAASAALALAVLTAAGATVDPATLAHLAWQGDVIAHGGVASGLDSSGAALGGLTRYTLADGPQPLASDLALPLVVGDTGVQANTATVNTRVRRWLAAHPARHHLFVEMGWLAQQAEAAIHARDLSLLGHLMNLNQLLLEKLGVSSPELERLIEAALEAGALGTKLSGSGGGGIMVALCAEETRDAVAAAIEAAGGRALATTAGVAGAQVEEDSDQ